MNVSFPKDQSSELMVKYKQVNMTQSWLKQCALFEFVEHLMALKV